ncbi:hypothetical protein A2777_06210 [Candidatus Gottesmanbacteria bacterium RIFCSPHIGHO2_01_FULL_40_15]|uniref:Uncharacterized protein n=1 Tax=Candidatus Gottesmanbacteria bacterium RIFCSPHIGHO2_01_FULL_40_15 TaxID=1798376 RepID=A0A1F5Z7Y0_9BACT|nr:MAG: hypothetical protein A2777_06210 [Candidatus Gottesmanbacteria bacterium RIFCSPHIGHO2_01_FULL_40_15]
MNLLRNNFTVNKFAPLIFILLFLLFAFPVSRLNLYLDDVSYIFPSIVGNYQKHFTNYMRDNGFNRPFALFYYYTILKIYIFSPALAHLIPLLFLMISGWLLYKTLMLQGIDGKISLAAGVALMLVPFSVEQYVWFSASVGVVALSVFMLQLYLIMRLPAKFLIYLTVFILQIISSFLYETTLFMPLAIAFLFTSKQKLFSKTSFLKKYIISFTGLILPVTAYIFIKIRSPYTVDPEFEISKAPQLFDFVRNYFAQFFELFWTKGPGQFWKGQAVSGFNLIMSFPLFFSFFTVFLLLLFMEIFRNRKWKKAYFSYNKTLIFWILVLVGSLIPLIWKEYYLPFRTLFLPVLAVIILLGVVFSRFSGTFPSPVKNLFKGVFVLSVIWAASLNFKMIDNFRRQYLWDLKMMEEIRLITEDLGFNSERRTNLLLTNIPHNSVSTFIYGDYIYSLFNQDWTAVGFIDLNSGTIKEVGIELADKNIFSGNYSRSYFESLIPLTVLKYKGDFDCRLSSCFELTYTTL